jgi:hypothetical protein
MHRQIIFFFIFAFASLFTTQGQVVINSPEFLPRYKLLSKFSGGMADHTDEAILLQNHQGAIEQFDLKSKTLFLLRTNFGSPAHIIPNGFLLYSTNGLLQIEGNEEIELGQISRSMLDFGTRVVEGRFGILRTGEGRLLRDFVARTNLLLSTHEGFADVSANGSVAFSDFAGETNLAIRWYHDAKFETVALLPRFPLPHVASDGTNVLWSEPETPFGSVFLQTPDNRIQLSTNTFVAESGGPMLPPRMSSVAMKNGWTIFPRWAPNNPGTLNNLWRRSPAGEITQLTGVPAFVLAMADDGGAIIAGGDGRIQSALYYIPPVGEAKPLGDNYGSAQYFSSGNKFYAFSPLQSGGCALFELEVETDPFGLIYPKYNPETKKFSAAVVPGMPGTFLLEHTQDFVEWSTIETIHAEGVYSVPIEITSPPGFFRLRKQ